MGFLNPESEFMEFLGKVADFVILNLLTVLCSLPVFTAGAAFTARNYVAMKIVRGEEPAAVKSYFHSFKENFRQVTPLWMVAVVFIAVLVYDWRRIATGSMALPSPLVIALGVMTFLFWSVLYGASYLLARFHLSSRELFKGSVVMAILNIPKMAVILIVTVLPYIICLWYMQWGLAIWLFCTTVSLYYISKDFDKQLAQLIPGMNGEEAAKDGTGEAAGEAEGTAAGDGAVKEIDSIEPNNGR